MSVELKPCPFCGAVAGTVRLGHRSVICGKCGTFGPVGDDGVSQWNKRTPDDREELERQRDEWRDRWKLLDRQYSTVVKYDCERFTEQDKMIRDLRAKLAAVQQAAEDWHKAASMKLVHEVPANPKIIVDGGSYANNPKWSVTSQLLSTSWPEHRAGEVEYLR